MNAIEMELQKRWRQMFTALASGDDSPPSERLRAEGMMEAAVLTGEASVAVLQSAMSAVYIEVYGHSMESNFGEQWREFFPFPQIPAMANRAPVYPSTAE
ncbi:MAG: hypothetical protein V7746_06840 [Halioglobus sp.]